MGLCMQEGKKLPKLTEILESDDEPEPDVVLEVPVKKVKMVVGPGGERIKLIERKSKARLQVRAMFCCLHNKTSLEARSYHHCTCIASLGHASSM